jgi:hypothetical protein
MIPKELLEQLGGLQSVAGELGITPHQAQSGAAALLPAILGGMKKQAQARPGGVDGLGGLLSQLGGGGLLDNVLSPQPTDVGLGNNVLGQIFGSKDVSRTVAAQAAGKSGLDPSTLKKLLPIVAMLVAGYMAKRGGGAARPGATPAGGGLGGLLGGILGGGAPGSSGLAGMLDMDGNGNPLDDILRMAGKR